MKQLIILGAGLMQGPAIRLAKEMGLETVVADGDPQALNAPLADRFEPIDLRDKEGIEALARSLKAGGRLGGIMTAGTDFSATVAWTAEKLGLPGIPYEAALNASDKERMRRCFRAAGVPSPAFLGIVRGDSLPELPFRFPAVVKPVDNMGGRGCRRVDSPAELEAALPEALGFSRSGRAIVEEYMEGPEFSVDALIFRGKILISGLADRHIYFPPYFIEMGHTMPTAFPQADQDALLAAFSAGARSLGLLGETCFGAAKGDIKLTPRGPMIGEIAARLSGGYMSGWTYPYASGVEVTRGAILAALGEEPPEQGPGSLEARRDWTSAERAFISIPGRVRSIHGLEAARERPLVKDLFLRAGEGSPVCFPENNVSKCGNLISAAPGRAVAVAAAEEAVRAVLFRLVSPDPGTDAFLAASSVFPPGAFSLSPELRAALTELPDPALPRRPAPGWDPVIISFPALSGSDLRDYAGRTVRESLDAVRSLTGLSLPELAQDAVSDRPVLGRNFWAALVRGGYQGAVYSIDRLFGTGRGANENR
ncbi:MAG: ATP-grasp domain-containing protein [Treponema sp.]|nr:ATP-grasp domain-containing protein [Treponema sp.]